MKTLEEKLKLLIFNLIIAILIAAVIAIFKWILSKFFVSSLLPIWPKISIEDQISYGLLIALLLLISVVFNFVLVNRRKKKLIGERYVQESLIKRYNLHKLEDLYIEIMPNDSLVQWDKEDYLAWANRVSPFIDFENNLNKKFQMKKKTLKNCSSFDVDSIVGEMAGIVHQLILGLKGQLR